MQDVKSHYSVLSIHHLENKKVEGTTHHHIIITMTSHTLARFDGSKDLQEDCAFCRIVAKSAEAHIVYQDEENIAFLDILPLRRGHTLVVPKRHVQQLSHLEPDQAASLGKALVITARAVGKGKDQSVYVSVGFNY